KDRKSQLAVLMLVGFESEEKTGASSPPRLPRRFISSQNKQGTKAAHLFPLTGRPNWKCRTRGPLNRGSAGTTEPVSTMRVGGEWVNYLRRHVSYSAGDPG